MTDCCKGTKIVQLNFTHFLLLHKHKCTILNTNTSASHQHIQSRSHQLFVPVPTFHSLVFVPIFFITAVTAHSLSNLNNYQKLIFSRKVSWSQLFYFLLLLIRTSVLELHIQAQFHATELLSNSNRVSFTQ